MAKNDWYEAGEAIRNLVQNAVENQDFTQLSSTIANVINQTVDGFQDALRESLRGYSQGRGEDYAENSRNYQRNETDRTQNYREKTADQSQTDRRGGMDQTQNFREDEAYAQNFQENEEKRARNERRNGANYDPSGSASKNYRYRTGGMRFSGQEAAERIRRNMEAKKREFRPAGRKLKAPGRAAGWLLAATGYGFGSMFGLALVIVAIVNDAVGGIPDLVCEILAVFTGLNLWMGVAGGRRLGLANRFQRYAAMLGNRTYCMIEELASGTGKTIDYIRKDLKKMLRKGFFPEGHLDRKEMCLITDNETYQQYLLTPQEADRRAVFGEAAWSAENAGASSGPVSGRSGNTESGLNSGQSSDNGGNKGRDFEEKSRTQANGNSQTSLNQECSRLIDEGRRYIAHIRECNDRIAGEEMSAKLDRLELVVTRIFREVERRPELAPELRKMMSYYLPTTQKLIDAYCQFDEQPIRGQNIDSTRKEIESALDTINQAFENLLDGFFENTAWDISSDISVLHTMFAQEGLTGKDFPKGGK